MKITNGNLTVKGSVKERATIELIEQVEEDQVQKDLRDRFADARSTGAALYIGNEGHAFMGPMKSGNVLHVEGNVGDAVNFTTHHSGIRVGTVGNNCTFEVKNIGDIKTGNVGQDTILKTMSGSIACQEVGERSSLETYNGNTHAIYMGENTKATTYNGKATADGKAASAKVNSYGCDLTSAPGIPRMPLVGNAATKGGFDVTALTRS